MLPLFFLAASAIAQYYYKRLHTPDPTLMLPRNAGVPQAVVHHDIRDSHVMFCGTY
jgi:hypothetical protein